MDTPPIRAAENMRIPRDIRERIAALKAKEFAALAGRIKDSELLGAWIRWALDLAEANGIDHTTFLPGLRQPSHLTRGKPVSKLQG